MKKTYLIILIFVLIGILILSVLIIKPTKIISFIKSKSNSAMSNVEGKQGENLPPMEPFMSTLNNQEPENRRAKYLVVWSEG